MKEIETLDSQIVYQNKWMSVREDKIRRPSGAEGIYGVVDKPDFVVILPVEGDGVYLVEQYRYPVEKRFLEFPQGAWENKPDADPKQLAAGELREETGLHAARMEYLGFQYLAYGFSSQGYHIYLASDFVQGETCLDPEEEGLISKKVSLDEFEQMILAGDILDSTTINAYSIAKLKGFL